MPNDLPITLKIKYLFEESDHKASRLITKVEAWLNFRALAANWYADENKVIEIDFTVMPESKFLEQEVDEKWQQVKLSTGLAVYLHNKPKCHFNCFVMLANEEIKNLMKQPETLETFLQQRLAEVASHLGQSYQLAELN